MERKKIIDYIMESPMNTNPAILNQLLDDAGARDIEMDGDIDLSRNNHTVGILHFKADKDAEVDEVYKLNSDEFNSDLMQGYIFDLTSHNQIKAKPERDDYSLIFGDVESSVEIDGVTYNYANTVVEESTGDELVQFLVLVDTENQYFYRLKSDVFDEYAILLEVDISLPEE